MDLNKLLIFISLCGITIIWCLGWFFTKLGLSYSSPFSFTTARFVIASIIMVVALPFLSKNKLPSREFWLPIAAVGFLQTALMFVLSAYGLVLIDLSRATILIYTTPLWSVLLGPIFLKEELNTSRILCVILGCIGIGLIILPSIDNAPLLGYLLLMTSSFCWAISILVAKRYLSKADQLHVLVWQTVVGTFGLILFGFFIDEEINFTFNFNSISALIYVSVFGTIVAMYLWFFIIQRVEMIQASLASLAVPVFVMLINSIFLDGSIDVGLILGSLLIILSILVVLLQPQNAVKKRNE
jgi:drug/metabolite transporter (DMT)-like permease